MLEEEYKEVHNLLQPPTIFFKMYSYKTLHAAFKHFQLLQYDICILYVIAL